MTNQCLRECLPPVPTRGRTVGRRGRPLTDGSGREICGGPELKGGTVNGCIPDRNASCPVCESTFWAAGEMRSTRDVGRNPGGGEDQAAQRDEKRHATAVACISKDFKVLPSAAGLDTGGIVGKG